ncbi:4Fe-4S binding protein [Georgenia sp. EYE_87]|uniref:ATP-binding protein n=1 Tax=Georgenia sp. EYE_87 TaxID=2853448 RepID=UPI002004C10B|nr:4Fe-4S dicluster domain-containing protein [Georgenia sp. EYE_87]MCK6212669.1 4Fe-4S binding protein [Georgenia sp. EYE_87]
MSGTVGLRGVQAWLVRQPEPRPLELVCAEHPGASLGDRRRVVVRLGSCAADLAAHELLELLTLGAPDVLVRLDGCAAATMATSRLGPLVALLESSGVDRLRVDGPDAGPTDAEGPGAAGRWPRGSRRRRAVLDAEHMPLSRRQVMGLADPAPRQLPDEDAHPQVRLVAAARQLVAPDAPALAALAGPAAALSARGCTACGVCVQACPTDALALRHSAASGPAITTLLQDPAACDGCLRCVDLCPQDALTAAGQESWKKVLGGGLAPVQTLSTAPCERCGTRFPTPSGERLCPVCAYRRANPFGSVVPPAAQRAAV